jgi:hypothetical protein
VPDLEQQLAALAVEIDWPPTPKLRPIREEVPVASRRSAWPRWERWFSLPGGWARSGWGRPAAVAVAAVLIVAIALFAYPPSRDAIARWVNLHTIIQRVPNPPTPSALPSGSTGDRLRIGSRTTLDQAQRVVSWRIVVPAALGQPDEVYLKVPPSGPSLDEVTLVYTSRPDIAVSRLTGVAVLVMEARGKFNDIFFQKSMGSGSTIEEMSVGGHVGYWITGDPHDFFFTDAAGTQYFDTLRLAGNTLIFDDNGTLVRIEGDLTKDQAVRIGSSM